MPSSDPTDGPLDGQSEYFWAGCVNDFLEAIHAFGGDKWTGQFFPPRQLFCCDWDARRTIEGRCPIHNGNSVRYEFGAYCQVCNITWRARTSFEEPSLMLVYGCRGWRPPQPSKYMLAGPRSDVLGKPDDFMTLT